MTSLSKTRIESIDLLRGAVIIIMALDHVRGYFHADHFLFSPTDLTKTTPILFFTRWITHFCAPAFVFLAGTSAFFVSQRKSKNELSRFLFTRGLWLMVLELTVVNFGWFFNPEFPFLSFQVIWALGVSMIALSALIHLPQKVILAIGLIILFGHNLLDNIHVDGNSFKAFLWAELHDRKSFTFLGRIFRTGYPVLAWIGIMTLGYSFGSFYKKEIDAQKRKKYLLTIGASAITLFFVIRAFNAYGDMAPWTIYDNSISTILSFLNVSKYPPSLLYTLVTLGPCMIFLALAEKPLGKMGLAISTVGRVPMFFYILHIYFIHALAMLAITFTDKSWKDMIMVGNKNPQLEGYGFSLWVVYLVWIAVILLLYPLCKRYDTYKTNHKEKWWLSYL
ncbi:MAG: heparan-alpha-glucosaminide N-acetyltransferase domain-containing protein [Bacteroidota bacterium]|nr:heparan-alpha-glucosaminide N-acetyltransferase domain-containing protein [Bacteroidota bacterium]